MPSISGSFIAYKTIQLLTKPFEDWDAYKLGIIDKNGNTIKSPRTAKEKASFDMFQIMVRNLKKLLSMFPFGKTKVASFAAALWLIKEQTDGSDEFEKMMLEHLQVSPADIILNEEVELVLESGIYVDTFGRAFHIKADTLPVANYLGCDIYELQEVVSNDTHFVTPQNLKSYK